MNYSKIKFKGSLYIGLGSLLFGFLYLCYKKFKIKRKKLESVLQSDESASASVISSMAHDYYLIDKQKFDKILTKIKEVVISQIALAYDIITDYQHPDLSEELMTLNSTGDTEKLIVLQDFRKSNSDDENSDFFHLIGQTNNEYIKNKAKLYEFFSDSAIFREKVKSIEINVITKLFNETTEDFYNSVSYYKSTDK